LAVPSTAARRGKGEQILGPWFVRYPASERPAGETATEVVEVPMTTDKDFKRIVRARAKRTGESYAEALRQLRTDPAAGATPASARSQE
jgi:hypothetical protein